MTMTDERTQTRLAAPAPTAFDRAEKFWQTRPGVSAGVSFLFCAGFTGATMRYATAQDYLWMTVAYAGALAAALSGAFETKRAGQGRAL
jgi:hypothetical protein